MNRVILYAPVDIGFEIGMETIATGDRSDYRERVSAFTGRLDDLTDDNWQWEFQAGPGGEEVSNTAFAYGSSDFRANPRWAPYVAIGRLGRDTGWYECITRVARGHGLEPGPVHFCLQAYGICVLEIEFGVPDDVADKGAQELGRILVSLCATEPDTDARDAGGAELTQTAQRIIGEMAFSLAAAANESAIARQTGADSVVHRRVSRNADGGEHAARLIWWHSLVIADSPAAPDGGPAPGGTEWCREIEASGRLPERDSDAFHYGALAFKHCRVLEYVAREARVAVVFGWGNTLLVQNSGDTGDSLDDVPIRYVLRVLQCVSAALFMLNQDLLSEALGDTIDNEHGTRAEFDRSRAVETMRLRAEVFLSSVEDQRYSMSFKEMSLWDASSDAWDMERLVSNIRHNIELLGEVYRRRSNELAERRRRLLRNGLTLITVASSAQVLFHIMDSYFRKGSFAGSEIWAQTGVLGGLILFAAVLLWVGRER